MTYHQAAGHPPTPCTKDAFGSCPICDRIEVGGPRYSEAYRRLFHPEEFAHEAEAVNPEARAGSLSEAPVAPVVPAPIVPLAGDIVAGLAAAVGADRLAKWTAKQLTGVPSCGCAARQDKLNEIDLKARKLLRRLAGRGEA